MVPDFAENDMGSFSTTRFRKGVSHRLSFLVIVMIVFSSQPAIFEDIAQEAITLCRQSLIAASDMIRSKNTPSSKLDAPLFLVRHLLILKEMMHNLDFAQREVQPRIDLGGVTGPFFNIIICRNMDADGVDGRNAGFDIESNDFFVTKCTICVPWNA